MMKMTEAEFQNLRVGGLYRIEVNDERSLALIRDGIFMPHPSWGFLDQLGHLRHDLFNMHYDSYKEQGNKQMCQWFANALENYTYFDRRAGFAHGDCFILLGSGRYIDLGYAQRPTWTYLRVLMKGIYDCYMEANDMCDGELYKLVLL